MGCGGGVNVDETTDSGGGGVGAGCGAGALLRAAIVLAISTISFTASDIWR